MSLLLFGSFFFTVRWYVVLVSMVTSLLSLTGSHGPCAQSARPDKTMTRSTITLDGANAMVAAAVARARKLSVSEVIAIYDDGEDGRGLSYRLVAPA